MTSIMAISWTARSCGGADDAGEEEDLADVLVDAMSNLDDGGLI